MLENASLLKRDFEVEMRLSRKDHTAEFYSAFFFPLTKPLDVSFLYSVCVSRNITHQKRSEEALVLVSGRLRDFTDLAGVFYFETDRLGCFVYCTENFRMLLGLGGDSNKSTLEKSLLDYLDPGSALKLQNFLNKMEVGRNVNRIDLKDVLLQVPALYGSSFILRGVSFIRDPEVLTAGFRGVLYSRRMV